MEQNTDRFSKLDGHEPRVVEKQIGMTPCLEITCSACEVKVVRFRDESSARAQASWNRQHSLGLSAVEIAIVVLLVVSLLYFLVPGIKFLTELTLA